LIKVAKTQEKLVNKYNYLAEEIEVEKLEIGTLNVKTALEERVSLLNIILMQYAYKTENLENIINMALQGLIHSSLPNIETFKSQLEKIKTQLTIGEGIPINLEDSGIAELIRLITTNVVYVENMLIFIMEILLVSSYKFILYKSIPLPIKLYNNTYVALETDTDYIAIDKSRLDYIIIINNNYLE